METPHAALPVPDQPQDDPTLWVVDDLLWAELAPILIIDKPRMKPAVPAARTAPCSTA